MRNAVRDLEYHDELLTLLRLPEQQNKDAVMILHMGGVFGDKAATLDRFREEYAKLSIVSKHDSCSRTMTSRGRYTTYCLSARSSTSPWY